MTTTATEPRAPLVEEAPSYWDIVRRQFRRNRPAVLAMRCVVCLVALAAAAPLLALNVPFLLKTKDDTTWPLFERLFDRLLFPSGVDVFFNLLLVLGAYWMAAAAALRAAGVAGETRRDGRAWAWGAVTLVLTVLYLVWGLGERSAFLPLLGIGVAGVVAMALSARARRRAPLRRQRTIRNRTRAGIAALFLATFIGMLTVGFDRRELVIYRPIVEELRSSGEGFALTPPVFYHPDNVAESNEVILAHSLKPPSLETRNLLGCDNNGRDVFARLLYGARISLTIGVIAVSIYVIIGTVLGSLAGYYGGKVDALILSILQVMLCIPSLFLLLTIIAVFDTRSIFMIMLAIGLISWTGVTRLVRGEFLRQKSSDYVMAARALGIPQSRIIFGHVLKNSLGPVLVSAAFGVGGAILAESFLSFLGLGDTTAPSWGQILNEGRAHRRNWLILSPGLAIFFVVTVLNIVGDGLRDALDPKLRQ